MLRRSGAVTVICRRHMSSSLDQVTPERSTLRQTDIKPYREMPGPKGLHRLPVLGTLLNFQPFTNYTAETLHQLLYHMAQVYGPVFRLQLGRDTVVVSSPADMGTVYAHEGRYPTRPNLDLREIHTRRTGVPSWDVSTLQGADWQALRMPLNKRLVKVDSASHYLHSQSLVADDFVQMLANTNLQPEELSELFFRFASESMAVVCFNKRLGLLKGNTDAETIKFLEATKIAFQMLHRSFTGKSFLHGLYRNDTYRQFEQAMEFVGRYSQRHIQKAKKLLEDETRAGTQTSTEPNLLLSLLLDPLLQEDQVTQIVESLYSAGTDSTAGSLQALFYNLAKHPEKQELLYQEVSQVVCQGQPVTQQDLSQMQYLKACVKESFRILYPVSGVMRFLPTDVVLGGYHVPAGVQILLGNVISSKTEFEDPEHYRPERWFRTSDARRPAGIPKFAVLPFGYGPRNCIGRRFAEQELYLATIKAGSSDLQDQCRPHILERALCLPDFPTAHGANQISVYQKGNIPADSDIFQT